jgi:hypothetical protein
LPQYPEADTALRDRVDTLYVAGAQADLRFRLSVGDRW